MSKNSITHTGVITSVNGNTVKVRILKTSACSSCQAKSTCGMTESSTKEISVNSDRKGLKPGDSVTIEASIRQGYYAVVIAYCLPALLLLAVLIIGNVMDADESTSAIAAILSLVPYFFVLYLFRDKIGKSINFRIK